MIIESGIDIVQVLCGSVSNDNPRGLWIIAMDENLRLLYVEPIAGEISGAIDDYADDIAMFLDGENRVEYFALAWSTDEVRERGSGWLGALDTRLREQLSGRGRRMLGQIVFDPHTMFASVPGCAFSLEPGLSDLPRALSIRGPHGPSCGCPVCAADRREMEACYDARVEYDDPAFWGDGVGVPRFVDEPRYDPRRRRWFPDPERAYKRWTLHEEADIARSHFAGLSCYDISILVKRQPSAIAARLNKLGISSSTIVVSVPVAPGSSAADGARARSDSPPSSGDPARPDG